MIFTGIQDGGYGKMIDASARIGSGHLTLEHSDYRRDPDINKTITDVRPYIEQLQKIPEVQGYSLRLSGQGMLASSYNSVGVFFDALEPEKERLISPIVGKISDGTYLKNEDPNGIIIGDHLAKKLRVAVGSKVVLTANNRQNQTLQELLKVAGIFHVGADAMDAFYFQMPFSKAQTIFNFSSYESLQIAVFLKSQRQTNAIVQQLHRKIDPSAHVAVLPWNKTMQDLANYIAMDRAWNYILQFLGFLVVSAGILNTILMSVMERSFEFGVIKALGTTPRRIFSLIVLEAAMIGLIGIFFGSIVGWAINIYFHFYPINLARITSGSIAISGYAMEPVLRTGLYWDHYLITCGAVYLLILIISLYPANRAARFLPVEALAMR
jgi:ABC-type lipoprotein release transport system permease subunit